jgi:hypothetical protein
MTKLFTRLLCVLTLAANVALAQVPGDLGNRFARATITENEKPLLMPTIFKDTQDNLIVMGAPLVNVIARAYGVQPYQIAGAPDWVSQAHLYDIEAVPPPAALIKADETQMLRSLLADRFGLRLYKGVKEVTMPVLDADLGTQRALAAIGIPTQIMFNVLRRRPVLMLGGPDARYFSRRLRVLPTPGVSTPVLTRVFLGGITQGAPESILDLTGLTTLYLLDSPVVQGIPTNLEHTLARSGLSLEQRTVLIDVLAVTAIERPRLDMVDQ